MNYLEPEAKYRPLNYWGWLEDIQPDEVKWQVRQMWEAGLGGYVMHARGGLQIPYMGSQWLEAVKAMVEEGKALGMMTVVDDEDGWPSGFGAGEVNGRGEDYWLKWLECEKVKASDLKTHSRTIGIYRLEGNRVQYLHDASEAGAEEELLHLYYDCSRYYVDNLDPKVVETFLEASYEAYYRKFGPEFGTGIEGIFSDEPQLAREHITWSRILPEQFAVRWGYDLVKVLPAIYYEVEGYEQVRYHYWRTVSELFAESYGRQIGQWCGQHGVSLMGHTTLEEGFAVQMMCSGSTMQFYEYMQIPGIDWLCRIPVNNMIVKQVASVAQQLGRERILSEMYGCAGWNVSFEELKWIAEGHYVLGINLMLQHLGLYSLKGSRKREYPASLFHQQPWWSEFRTFNDYFARLSKLMTESKPVIDLLVLHPIRSGWIAFRGGDHERVNHYDNEFQALTNSLVQSGFDFHYGDEEILRRHGRIEGKELRVGHYSYKTVVIPPSLTLDESTMELLLEFAGQGGLLISVGEYPHLVEGKPDDRLRRLKPQVLSVENSRDRLDECLNGRVEKKLTITCCDGSINEKIYGCTRKTEEGLLYYLVNTSRDDAFDVSIGLEEGTQVVRLDLERGTVEPIRDLARVHFEPTQSLMLAACPGDGRFGDTGESKQTEQDRQMDSQVCQISLDGEWDVAVGDENALTLDYCRYAIDNGPWQEELPVILLQEKLLALGKPVDIAMKFGFRLDADIRDVGKLYLVLEEPEKFNLFINGREVASSEEGWWIDKSFRKVSIEEYVARGENEILLTRPFYCSEKVYRIKNDKSIHEAEANRVTVETELESIYLLGRFAVNLMGEVRETDRRAMFVNPSFVLSAPVQKADIGNLATGGYPFFAGSIRLSRKFRLQDFDKEKEWLELSMNRPDAVVVKAFINGQEAKSFLWEPYWADVTEWVKEGENELVLELFHSCRNLLGPHHNTQGEIIALGPHAYRDMEHWTDDYCLVRFGVEDISIVKRKKKG